MLAATLRGTTTAAAVETKVAQTVMAGRRSARSASRFVVLADLMALGATPGGPAALVDVAAADAARAVRAARSLGQRAAALLRGGASAADTHAALAPARALVAATEAAEAHNLERAAVADASGGLVRIYKVWDAVLDRRTCPRCSGLDGAIVAIGESFAEAQPAHPRCRCTFTLLRADEIGGAVSIREIAS